jgi:hypothetical protein
VLNYPGTRERRGRSSAGRASPCHGEGRGFDSRRPLWPRGCGFALGRRRDWRHGRVVRQGSAKPCTPVRMRVPPLGPGRRYRQRRAISSGGERFLDAEEVSGSNPLSPTLKNGDLQVKREVQVEVQICSGTEVQQRGTEARRQLPGDVDRCGYRPLEQTFAETFPRVLSVSSGFPAIPYAFL